MSMTNTKDLIRHECDTIRDMLLAKNAAYGDSAMQPRRVFSRADAIEQIKVRIDDKLSRIATMGPDSEDEDTTADLIGYLVLLRIARRLVAPALNSAPAVAAGYVVPPVQDGDDDPAVVHIVPDRTIRATSPEQCLGALCGRVGR